MKTLRPFSFVILFLGTILSPAFQYPAHALKASGAKNKSNRVVIKLKGPTLDAKGNQNILVGQGCTASLSGLAANSKVSYIWGVTGTTFQSWTVSTDTLQSHTTEVDGPGRSDQPTAYWFWNDNLGSGGSRVEYVTCTATVTPPTGQGAAFKVTVKTPITVWVPAWSASGTGGSMYVVNTSIAGSPSYALQADPTPGSGDIGGMDWLAIVSAPSPIFGDGTVAIVQTLIPGDSYQTAGYNVSGYNYGYYYIQSNNGQQGLDTDYPYQEKPAASLWMASDSPSLPLTALNAISGVNHNQFKDFLLFIPPGSSQCVCVAQFLWTTNGSATLPNTGNWANWTGSAGPVSPSGTGKNSFFGQANAYPRWTQNIGDGTGSWIPKTP